LCKRIIRERTPIRRWRGPIDPGRAVCPFAPACGAHRFGGFAQGVAEVEHQKFEEKEHGTFEDRTHGQDRSRPRAPVARHGLDRQGYDQVGGGGVGAMGFGGQAGDGRAGGAGLADQGGDGRKPPGAGRHEEQVARADRRAGHVALHMGVPAQVKKPHGQRAHHQPFAPAAVNDDAPRLCQRPAKRPELCRIDGGEAPAQFLCRLGRAGKRHGRTMGSARPRATPASAKVMPACGDAAFAASVISSSAVVQ
jgi:hypothetical protein